jgi:hypothetical protein
MPESVETASTFNITELTGQRRAVVLAERGLPYRPFTLKRSQRKEVTWYPGNPEGTLTVLGAQVGPTSVHGMWKDVFVGSGPTVCIALNGQQVSTAKEAARLFDSICAEGQLVEVTWDEEVRVGVLSDFEHSYENVHDVAWQMDFEWISDGSQAGAAAIQQGTSAADTAGVMAREQANLDQASGAPFATDPDFNAALFAAVGACGASVGQMRDVVTNMARQALTPFDAARRTVSIATGLIEQTKGVVTLMSAQPARALVVGASIGSMSLGTIVEAEVYARGVINAARSLMRTAVMRRSETARTLEGELAGVHTGRAGEDLRDVSQAFYGTTFEWRRLMIFNELTSSALEAGQLVLVPRMRQGGQ